MNKERYYHKLETIKESGNYRILREIEHNGFLIHDDGREMLNLSSNDYLGLSSNPRLIEEFREETDVMALPYSAVSSRLLSGNHPYYKMLEDDLADLYDKEAALVFNSGYHANIGILPALTNKRDLIVADKLVHASIIDGLRLSEAQMIRYKHLDYEHLRSILTQHREEYDNVFIVTESIFSMDGDTSDLQQLCEIKKEFDAFLYVDEAHAVGVRGTNGLGCCEEQACMEDIDFIVGTFGKAFASMGAFVVCEQVFRDYFDQYAKKPDFYNGFASCKCGVDAVYSQPDARFLRSSDQIGRNCFEVTAGIGRKRIRNPGRLSYRTYGMWF